MNYRFPALAAFTRPSVAAVVLALLCGCAATEKRWALIEPGAPTQQATVVGIAPNGAAWFFWCDERQLTAGLRPRKINAQPDQEQLITIKFDSEPAEQSLWRAQANSYVMHGQDAIALARRAALAYDAVVGIDGSYIDFSLAGSHGALIGLTRTCPFLDVQ